VTLIAFEDRVEVANQKKPLSSIASPLGVQMTSTVHLSRQLQP